MSSKIAVAEAMDEVFASKDGSKETQVIAAKGIEAPHSVSVEGGRLTELVEQVVGLRGIIDRSQSGKVSHVGAEADLLVAPQIGDPLGHGVPPHNQIAVAFSPAPDEKLVGMIDHCLDSQYAPVFVVHFHPVLFHPVFHPGAATTLGATGHEFSLEVAVELFPEEGHDILGAEAEGGVPQQFWIQPFKAGTILEYDVGSEFGLVDDPVVLHPMQDGFHQWIDLGSEDRQDSLQVDFHEAVSQTLDARGILQSHEGVLDHLVVDVTAVQFPGKPFVAVDVDLDREGKPRLDSYVHESEVTVDEVEVQAEASGVVADQLGLALAVLELEAAARLVDRQNAHEAVVDLVLLCDPPGVVLLARVLLQILVRPARSPGDVFGVLLQCFRAFHDESFEVLHQHLLVAKKICHAFREADGKIALEDDPVEAGKNACNFFLVFYYEFLHGVVLVVEVPIFVMAPSAIFRDAMIQDQRHAWEGLGAEKKGRATSVPPLTTRDRHTHCPESFLFCGAGV